MLVAPRGHLVSPGSPPLWSSCQEQPPVNICSREILADKRAGRLLGVTARGGLGLAGEGWALWEVVSMGSRNLALLVPGHPTTSRCNQDLLLPTSCNASPGGWDTLNTTQYTLRRKT